MVKEEEQLSLTKTIKQYFIKEILPKFTFERWMKT